MESLRTSFPTRCGSLYTDRGEFAEYRYLVQALEDCATAEFIPQDQLLSGNLVPYLTRLLRQERKLAHRTSGRCRSGGSEDFALDRSLNRYHNVSGSSIDRPSSIYQT